MVRAMASHQCGSGSFPGLDDPRFQGHPTDRFGKLSVRKALNRLQFSKGNFHFELSLYGKL